MKILHVAPTYYPATYWGGPIFSVYALNNHLSEHDGVGLTVLTTNSAGPDLASRIIPSKLNNLFPGYKVYFEPRIALSSISIGLILKLPKLVKESDVVHLTATYSFPTLPTLCLCRLYGKPLVWSPRGAILEAHSWERSRKQNLKLLWEKICIILMKGMNVFMHVTSIDEKHAAQERLMNVQTALIPNGVECIDIPSEREWLPSGKLRLMYIGRISQKKGIENLISAMSLLPDDLNVSLKIYGTGDPGYLKSLQDLALEYRSKNGSIQFMGHVVGEDKKNAFLNSDLCVVPSYTENFCNVVAESLGHAVPVIASHGTPWSEVEEYKCGLWVDNKPQTIATAIEKISKMCLKTMGYNGWQWMKREYSWGNVSNQMYNLYSRMIEHHDSRTTGK